MSPPIYTFNSIPDLTITPFSDTSDGIAATFGDLPKQIIFSVDDFVLQFVDRDILSTRISMPGGVTNLSLSAPFGAFSVLFALNNSGQPH